MGEERRPSLKQSCLHCMAQIHLRTMKASIAHMGNTLKLMLTERMAHWNLLLN